MNSKDHAVAAPTSNPKTMAATALHHYRGLNFGHNLVSLHAWHTRRGQPEPWQVHLGEPIDDRPLDKATRTRGRGRHRSD